MSTEVMGAYFSYCLLHASLISVYYALDSIADGDGQKQAGLR